MKNSKYGNFGGVGFGKSLGFTGLRGNQYNLTSPYRHVGKNESIDIHNSFMDKND